MDFLSKNDFNISKVLLYVDHSFNDVKVKTTFILTASTSAEYIVSTKRFDALLFQNLTHLLVYVQFIFCFCHAIVC